MAAYVSKTPTSDDKRASRQRSILVVAEECIIAMSLTVGCSITRRCGRSHAEIRDATGRRFARIKRPEDLHCVSALLSTYLNSI
jgi:hypothetical protein